MMAIYCVLAPIVGFGVGFMVANFSLYFWTVEAVVEVHRWGFIAVAVTVTIMIFRYLLDNHLLADRLAVTRYEEKKSELIERQKKLDIRDYNLESLYKKHRVYQDKIEQELIRKNELNADLRKKLVAVENLIAEMEQINFQMVTTSGNEGRSNRHQKKIEKIIQNAESIRNGVMK